MAAPSSTLHNAGHRSATRSPTVQLAALVDDQLIILLANDRLGRTAQPHFAFPDDSRNGHDPDQDQLELIDEPLATALSEVR